MSMTATVEFKRGQTKESVKVHCEQSDSVADIISKARHIVNRAYERDYYANQDYYANRSMYKPISYSMKQCVLVEKY